MQAEELRKSLKQIELTLDSKLSLLSSITPLISPHVNAVAFVDPFLPASTSSTTATLSMDKHQQLEAGDILVKEIEAMLRQLESLVKVKLPSLNRGGAFQATTTLNLARHEDLLADYQREFRKSKVQRPLGVVESLILVLVSL